MGQWSVSSGCPGPLLPSHARQAAPSPSSHSPAPPGIPTPPSGGLCSPKAHGMGMVEMFPKSSPSEQGRAVWGLRPTPPEKLNAGSQGQARGHQRLCVYGDTQPGRASQRGLPRPPSHYGASRARRPGSAARQARAGVPAVVCRGSGNITCPCRPVCSPAKWDAAAPGPWGHCELLLLRRWSHSLMRPVLGAPCAGTLRGESRGEPPRGSEDEAP